MSTATLILSGRYVVPIIPEQTVLEDHSVVIAGKRILALLPRDEALQRYPHVPERQFPQHAIMPGLVNTHTHTPMNLFRGIADDLTLMDWLTQHIWPAEQALIDANTVALGSELAIAEMIRGGTTCFNDSYFYPRVTATAVDKTGMRAVCGAVIMSISTQWADNERTYFDRAEETVTDQQFSDRVTFSLCPHSPYTVSDTSFTRLSAMSEQFNLPVHIHLHETEYEINHSLKQYGMRPIARLDRLGLLSTRLIGVHATQLTPEEHQLLAKRGCHIVHCPQSNLKLASGFAPVTTLLNAGVNVALGTDSAASNNDLDMFSELSIAAMLAKAVSQDPSALPAHQALSMATINGAKALKLDHKIGSLTAGKQADCIAVDLGHFLTQPMYNPISHLAYAVNRLQVSDVYIDGKALLTDGELTTIDTDSLIASAQAFSLRARRFATHR